jgi:hypothetical protein
VNQFLLDLCQRIQNSQVGEALHGSQYMFPLIETTHVLALAASVGLILMTDLRLVGAFMTAEPVFEVTFQLKRLMWSGFVVMFLSGALLFWSEAAKCYLSPTFRWKILFLLLAGLNAVAFEATLGRRVADWGMRTEMPSRARFAGWASLVCWTGVILFGRWTAYGMK